MKTRPISMGKAKTPYPYLVRRYMPAIYGAYAVRFVSDEKEFEKQVPHSVAVLDPEPYKDGKLTSRARQALIDIVQHCIKEFKKEHAFGQKWCVVFGEKDAVYVEPDGRTWNSPDLPSAGLWFGHPKKEDS